MFDGLDKKVVLYINNPPKSEELFSLISRLEDPLDDLIRWSDSDAPVKPLNLDERFIVKQILDNPKIMQRPIIDDGTRAQICRTPEKLQLFL